MVNEQKYSDSTPLPFPDPFDADVSSPEDGSEMVLGVDDVPTLTSDLDMASNDQSDELGVPPLKTAKLNMEDVS